jgi:hypothetical protein
MLDLRAQENSGHQGCDAFYFGNNCKDFNDNTAGHL